MWIRIRFGVRNFVNIRSRRSQSCIALQLRHHKIIWLLQFRLRNTYFLFIVHLFDMNFRFLRQFYKEKFKR
jgi:hypothetical protein